MWTPDRTCISFLYFAQNKWTPLHEAATNNACPEIVEKLLEYGAELNAKDFVSFVATHMIF